MADQDPNDTIMKDRGAATLAGNEAAIRTPGDVSATNAANRAAFTYPRVDAPGGLAQEDPHLVREFKAFYLAGAKVET